MGMTGLVKGTGELMYALAWDCEEFRFGLLPTRSGSGSAGLSDVTLDSPVTLPVTPHASRVTLCHIPLRAGHARRAPRTAAASDWRRTRLSLSHLSPTIHPASSRTHAQRTPSAPRCPS